MVARERPPIVFPGGEEFIPPDLLTKKAGPRTGKGVGACLTSEKKLWKKLQYKDRETGETKTVHRVHKDDKRVVGKERGGGSGHIAAMFGRIRCLVETLWSELHVSQQEQAGFASAHYYPETLENYNTMFHEIQDLCVRRKAQQTVNYAINQRELIIHRIGVYAKKTEFLSNDIGTQSTADQLCLEMADLIRSLRFQTLELMHLIYKWRTIATGKQFAPYIWKGMNYISKMATDLDFLATTHFGTVLKHAGIDVKGNPMLLWPEARKEAQLKEKPHNAKEAIKLAEGLWDGTHINALANLQIKNQKHRILRSLGVDKPTEPTSALLLTERNPMCALTLQTSALSHVQPERGADVEKMPAIGQKPRPRVAYGSVGGGVVEPAALPTRTEDLQKLIAAREARKVMAASGGKAGSGSAFDGGAGDIAALNQHVQKHLSAVGFGASQKSSGSFVAGRASASPSLPFHSFNDTTLASAVGCTPAAGAATALPESTTADKYRVGDGGTPASVPLSQRPAEERWRALDAARGTGVFGIRSISSINTDEEEAVAAARQQRRSAAKQHKKQMLVASSLATPLAPRSGAAAGGFNIRPAPSTPQLAARSPSPARALTFNATFPGTTSPSPSNQHLHLETSTGVMKPQNKYKYPAHVYDKPRQPVFEARKTSIRRLLGPSELSAPTMITCDILVHAEMSIQQEAAVKAILFRKCYAIELVKHALRSYRKSTIPLHLKQVHDEERRVLLKSELAVYEKAEDEENSDNMSANGSESTYDSAVPSVDGDGQKPPL
eukprot:TRINITY_DN33514_c0_g1_i1.p1 TRINITY_DN33514_c0_g1~~TRINITY_DN33514_c0_g1_i1.p1  ORF type:complete len:781 (+),score=284.44 TRINITY_DN33514_c0_g1_i1:76-2418(+)